MLPQRCVIVHKDHPFSPLGIHSGAEMATVHLAEALARAGSRVDVLGRIASGDDTYRGVRYRSLGEWFDLRRAMELLTEEAPIDALVAVTRADVLVKSVALSTGSADERIRERVLWLQDSDPTETCASVDQIRASCDRIVYVSQALKRALEQTGFPQECGEVVPNGLDSTVFRPSDVARTGSPARIVYAGALVPEKGVDLLLEAFQLLSDRIPGVELWLYGSSELWRRRDYLDENRLSALLPRVRFRGAVTQLELAHAFQRASIAVVPSRSAMRLDPFPLSSIEAQACGCPVVVTRNGGLPEGILPGETGFVLEEETPSALAETLESALNDGERLERMRKRATEHAHRAYGWETIARRFFDPGKAPASRARPRSRVASSSPSRRGREGYRVAIFYVRLPQPDRYGGDFRLDRLMRSLVEAGHEVTLVARDSLLDPAESEQARRKYESLGVEVHVLSIASQRGGQWVQTKVKDLRDVLSGRSFDAAWILWWRLAAELVPRLRRLAPEARLVVDSVDVGFLRLWRKARLTESPTDYCRAASEKRDELAAYRTADAVVAITDEDRKVLRSVLPDVPVPVVPSVHEIAAAPAPFEARRDLLFVGLFDHQPNTDAAHYFVSQIFPEIRRRHRGIKIRLVGKSPPPSVVGLARDDVVVTGFVPDLAPLWQAARVSVAPLRFGSGMKTKIAQSLAEGLPVVTTDIGAEGMALEDGENARIANTPEAFANAVSELYTDEALWQRLSLAGRQTVRERWSPSVGRDLLLDALVHPSDDETSEENAPDEIEALDLLSQGYEWLSLGCSHAARSLFARVTGDFPRLSSGYAAMALLAERGRNDEETLRLLRLATEYAPSGGVLRARLARAMRLCGRDVEAKSELQRALTLDPLHPIVHTELGVQAFTRGDAIEAARSFRRAVEIDPTYVEALVGVARVMESQGELSSAHRIYLHALDLARERGDQCTMPEIEGGLVRISARLASPRTTIRDREASMVP